MTPRMLASTPAHEPIRVVLAQELERVGDVFNRQLESGLPAVNRLCAHIERYRGKMLRPTLTLICGLAASPGSEAQPAARIDHRHRVVAAVGEMIHMATLVHDDVLDEAQLRRQASTINYLRGNEAAVLLGDYLISNAFHLCSTLDRPEINRRIGEVTNTLCAGELLQLHHRDHWSVDESTYLEIVSRKTASLIGVCCELGCAISGGDTSSQQAMNEFGEKLGVAFQIQDDLLDFIGDEEIVGKTLGRDLAKGKLTLPLILFFAEAEPRLRERMLRWLGSPTDEQRSDEVSRLLKETGAVQRAQRRAARLVEEAKTRLSTLPPSPARDFLRDLADAVITREF